MAVTGQRYSVRAYWQNDGRSLAENTQRIAACLRRLAQTDKGFARLFEPPVSGSDFFKREAKADAVVMERLLVRGSLSYWASGPNLRLMTASHPGGETCFVEVDVDSFVLKLYRGGPTAERLLRSRESLVGVLETLVGTLEPTRAQVDAFRHSRAEGDLGRPRSAGWITYFAVPPGSLPPLPGVGHAEGLASGSLVVLPEEPAAERDLTQSAALERLSDVLRREGLL